MAVDVVMCLKLRFLLIATMSSFGFQELCLTLNVPVGGSRWSGWGPLPGHSPCLWNLPRPLGPAEAATPCWPAASWGQVLLLPHSHQVRSLLQGTRPRVKDKGTERFGH